MEIINSGLYSSDTFNDPFTNGPETHTLEWIVQPPCCDAEIGLVWRYVVYSVVLFWKYDVSLLQEFHPSRELPIGVGPLVDLVGKCDEQAQ